MILYSFTASLGESKDPFISSPLSVGGKITTCAFGMSKDSTNHPNLIRVPSTEQNLENVVKHRTKDRIYIFLSYIYMS